jgi:beta-glucosidase
VLLKNDGVLPLKPGLRIAVIGPLGDATRVLRGNYSSALSAPPISVVDGLRRAMPRRQVVLRAVRRLVHRRRPRADRRRCARPTATPGLLARYYNTTSHAARPASRPGRSAKSSGQDDLCRQAGGHPDRGGRRGAQPGPG